MITSVHICIINIAITLISNIRARTGIIISIDLISIGCHIMCIAFIILSLCFGIAISIVCPCVWARVALLMRFP